MRPELEVRALVLAGGGNRCIWQSGFWHLAAPEMGWSPRVVGAVSAGASMAALIFSGQGLHALTYMQDRIKDVRRNFYPENLFTSRPVFPHLGIYRGAMEELLAGEAFALLQAGPELRIAMARPPAWAGSLGGTFLGIALYSLEKALVHPLHPLWSARAGFEPLVATAQSCRDVHELVRLILASSCTPPFLPRMTWDGKSVLDGGLVDNVPLFTIHPGEGPTLVLLSRRYPPELLRGHQGVTYLMPSRPIAIGKWDYTRPQGMQEVFDHGRRDAELFLRQGPAALQR